MGASDAHPVPIKDSAYRVTFPILDADGDLVSSAAGLDEEFSEDGAAWADCNGTATEIGTNGIYYLDLINTEMGGDTVAIVIKNSSGKATPIVLYPQSSSNPIHVNVQTISGDATAADNVEADYDGTGYNKSASTIGTVTAVAAGGITASSIAADAIGASELAADAVAEIADAVWDEQMSGHLNGGSYGQAMRGLSTVNGEVNDASATTTSFIADGFTEATNDHFNGMIMVFTEGANLGEARVITDYTGATQTFTFGQAWTDAPADNDNFVIVPGSELGGTLAQVFRLFITLLSASGEIQANTVATDTITAAKIAANAITSSEIADGAITAAKIATDAIDADALASDAVTEIWNKAMTEISSVPAVNASVLDAVRWMFALSRNKITQDTTTQTLRNDADDTTIATSTVSDNGTTATRGEWTT